MHNILSTTGAFQPTDFLDSERSYWMTPYLFRNNLPLILLVNYCKLYQSPKSPLKESYLYTSCSSLTPPSLKGLSPTHWLIISASLNRHPNWSAQRFKISLASLESIGSNFVSQLLNLLIEPTTTPILTFDALSKWHEPDIKQNKIGKQFPWWKFHHSNVV